MKSKHILSNCRVGVVSHQASADKNLKRSLKIFKSLNFNIVWSFEDMGANIWQKQPSEYKTS